MSEAELTTSDFISPREKERLNRIQGILEYCTTPKTCQMIADELEETYHSVYNTLEDLIEQGFVKKTTAPQGIEGNRKLKWYVTEWDVSKSLKKPLKFSGVLRANDTGKELILAEEDIAAALRRIIYVIPRVLATRAVLAKKDSDLQAGRVPGGIAKDLPEDFDIPNEALVEVLMRMQDFVGRLNALIQSVLASHIWEGPAHMMIEESDEYSLRELMDELYDYLLELDLI